MTNPRAALSAQDARSQGFGLSARDVTKVFGGTAALEHVNLEVGPGRVHALLGSNGSGKSTLIKILAGVHQATRGGEITVGDRSVPSSAVTPADSAALGLRFVHQQLGLFPQLSIADNFAATTGSTGSPFSTIKRRDLHRRTSLMLEEFRIDAHPSDPVHRLRPSARTLLAIGRAMADREAAKVLVLDEPTESLPDHETTRLLDSIRELSAAGMTFIIVSHRLAEIAEVADDVTVLRDGVVVASAPMREMTRGELVAHITGKGTEVNGHPQRRKISGAPLLAVDRLSVGPVRDLSFHVRSGEVLGIAGLVGSGRSAVLEGLFAARPVRAGKVVLEEKVRRFGQPADAVRAGMALVPEGRVAQGLFLDQPVFRNITASSVRRYFTRGSLDASSEQARGATRMTALGIKAPSAIAPISTLSGGNQQKAILARWLETSPLLLLLDEPTQGVDVGARAEIHAIIRSAVDEGMSVILVSSDLDELCEMSDRIMILERGRMSHQLDSDLSVTRVAELMHGAG